MTEIPVLQVFGAWSCWNRLASSQCQVWLGKGSTKWSETKFDGKRPAGANGRMYECAYVYLSIYRVTHITGWKTRKRIDVRTNSNWRLRLWPKGRHLSLSHHHPSTRWTLGGDFEPFLLGRWEDIPVWSWQNSSEAGRVRFLVNRKWSRSSLFSKRTSWRSTDLVVTEPSEKNQLNYLDICSCGAADIWFPWGGCHVPLDRCICRQQMWCGEDPRHTSPRWIVLVRPKAWHTDARCWVA